MDKWKSVVFESDSVQTPQFKAFVKDFKNRVVEQLRHDNLLLEDFNVGHFYVSGFISNPVTNKLAYFSISDVRHFPNEWSDHVLIRTAQHLKDYTGGTNQYTTLDDIGRKAYAITS